MLHPFRMPGVGWVKIRIHGKIHRAISESLEIAAPRAAQLSDNRKAAQKSSSVDECLKIDNQSPRTD